MTGKGREGAIKVRPDTVPRLPWHSGKEGGKGRDEGEGRGESCVEDGGKVRREVSGRRREEKNYRLEGAISRAVEEGWWVSLLVCFTRCLSFPSFTHPILPPPPLPSPPCPGPHLNEFCGLCQRWPNNSNGHLAPQGHTTFSSTPPPLATHPPPRPLIHFPAYSPTPVNVFFKERN